MKIIGNPSGKDQAWTWNKEAKPVTAVVGGPPASRRRSWRASLTSSTPHPRRELDELEAELTLAFDAADEDGDIDLMQRLADAIDKCPGGRRQRRAVMALPLSLPLARHMTRWCR